MSTKHDHAEPSLLTKARKIPVRTRIIAAASCAVIVLVGGGVALTAGQMDPARPTAVGPMSATAPSASATPTPETSPTAAKVPATEETPVPAPETQTQEDAEGTRDAVAGGSVPETPGQLTEAVAPAPAVQPVPAAPAPVPAAAAAQPVQPVAPAPAPAPIAAPPAVTPPRAFPDQTWGSINALRTSAGVPGFVAPTAGCSVAGSAWGDNLDGVKGAPQHTETTLRKAGVTKTGASYAPDGNGRFGTLTIYNCG